MKNKKIVSIIIILVVILMIMYKIYQFYVVSMIEKSINDFLNYDNWKYSVTIRDKIEKTINEFYSNGILVSIDEKSQKYGYTNLNTNKRLIINKKGKNYNIIKTFKKLDKSLLNIPNLIEKIENNKKFNALFSIYLIKPIKYENKLALKIYTKNEIVVIDAENYLPIYMTRNLEKTYENSTIEFVNKYEFQINCVTEEDVKLPDLSQYEEIVNQ